MQTEPKTYRFSGLIAVLGVLTLLVALVLMIVLPTVRMAAWGVLALGIALLAVAFILEFRQVGRAITGRRGRFGVGTTVMASIFIGITLLVNAISIGNYHRFDLTGVSQFTLTSQTKEVLTEMETPVTALCFFVPYDVYGLGIRSYALNLLSEYQNYTELISIEEIDPDEQPDLARQYGIEYTGYQTVVFETENGWRAVSPDNMVAIEDGQIVGLEAENAFTSAILEVTGVVQKKVYFLTGHGEANINSNYSYARQELLDHLYKVAELDLTSTPGIPDDCTVLVIAAPREPLKIAEVEIIEGYLEGGGWAFVLLNPDPSPELGQLLSAWGIETEEGTVIDPSSYYVDPGMDYSMHNIIVPETRNEFGLSETCFPGATAIIPQEEYSGTIFMYPLVYTSQDSWLEKDFNPVKEEPEFNEGVDREGPLALGVLVLASPTEGAQAGSTDESELTRLVVLGDSDFASNQCFYNGSNGDLFLNSVEMLTTGEEIISIERKVLPFRRLVVGPEAGSFITYSSIGLLPLLVLIAGGIIWWRRR